MSLRLLVILIPVILLQAACSPEQHKKPAPPVKVGPAVVDRGDIELPLILSGNLTYTANTTVSARVSSQVTSLKVEDGQSVEKGQILLTLDQAEIKDLAEAASADLKKHTAELQYNKSEWEKNADLFKTGSVSQIQYDQKLSAYHGSRAQVEADTALLAKAKQDLKWTSVNAPITGVLANRYVEIGDWVSKGRKLFEISDYTRIYVKAFLPDKDVARLNVMKGSQLGKEADVTVDAYPGKIFKGKITYVGAAADRRRIFEVRVYVDNPKMLLREGMFARARTVPKRVKGVLRAPVGALLDKIRNNADNTVFLVDKEKKAQLTRIRIGANDVRHAQVISGLKEGDTVVVYGKEILSSGRRVELTGTYAPGNRPGKPSR